MSGKPEQNEMAERRNRTFMDMIRSMMSKCPLLESLSAEALKKNSLYSK